MESSFPFDLKSIPNSFDLIVKSIEHLAKVQQDQASKIDSLTAIFSLKPDSSSNPESQKFEFSSDTLNLEDSKGEDLQDLKPN